MLPWGCASEGSGGQAGGHEANGSEVAGGIELIIPKGFPAPTEPAENPFDPVAAELGRHLFYDPRLSGNGEQSCSSCHLQHLAFSDGEVTAQGSTGEQLARNSPSLTNAAYNTTLTWAHPGLRKIEDQVLIPIFGENPVELGVTGREEEVLARLRADSRYQELFSAAFSEDEDPFTFTRIAHALSSFVRTLISGNSPFDQQSFQGAVDAMSPSALRGAQLLYSEVTECHHCHGGFNFTHSSTHAAAGFTSTPFHNTGLYNIDGAGSYPPGNTGVHAVTGEATDMGKFRAPSLRNVEVTAPYMHDGSIATLEEVIRFYEAGGRHLTSGPLAGDGRANPYKSGFVNGFTLTDAERADLVEFLKSLTDQEFLTDPRFANPFEETEATE
jgi:cytochrome c peroxidase